jgi:hypothetical protein
MRITRIVCTIVYTIIMMHSCSNVAPTDSLTWDVNYIVPLLKEKITVSMLGLRAKNISDDSARTGDTLFVSQNNQFHQQCKSDIFTITETSDDWIRGDLVIRKLKLESLISGINIPNLSPLMKRSFDVTAQKMFWRDTVVLNLVKNIDFGHTSEVFQAIVKNHSLTTSIKDISYSVISKTDTLAFESIVFLAPQKSIIIKAGLDGFSSDDTVYIECSYVTDSINKKPDLQLSFTATLDGLHFKKAIINDSLLGFNFVYEKDVPFGQAGFNASFIDINSFTFPFTINNPLPVGLKVNSRINSIWDAEYCRQNSIESTNNIIENVMDSSYFKGDKILNIVVPRNRTDGSDDLSYHTIKLNNSRILPSWDEKDTINTLHFLINAEIIVEGKMVTVENVERAGIQIGTPSLTLDAINGYYTYEKRIESPSGVIPVLSESPTSDIAKNFRNRLIPDRTKLNVDIKFMFPDDTRFEKIDLLCRQFERDSNDVLDSMMFSMENVAAGKEYSHEASFNRIIERLPDSLRYSLTYIIKPYKKIHLDNKVISRNDNTFSALFDAKAEIAMTMFLVWGIRDTISFEFNRNAGSFPLSSQNIALMKSKDLEMSVMVHNNSNITGRLRAVQIKDLNVNNNDSVYLLGKEGLVLPARGNEWENFISFNETDVRSLTDPDSLSVKWIIDLFPCDIDALRDNDYIEINADLSLRGQHSTSSMFGFQ